MATIKEMANDTNGQIRDFINPKSAITMGASAAMVLAFTTTLCNAFVVLPAAIVALVLSIMFGTAQVMYLDDKVFAKVFYGVVCSLIIFNAARGGNLTIRDATGEEVKVAPAKIELQTSMLMPDIFIGTAYSAETNKVSPKTSEYFYWTNTVDGVPIYTNIYGNVYTNNSFKSQKIFNKWEWKK